MNNNRLLLRQKLVLIKEQYQQLEIDYERKIKKQNDIKEKYDFQINHLHLSIQEYVKISIFTKKKKNFQYYFYLGKSFK